jgi:hypothetical protein
MKTLKTPLLAIIMTIAGAGLASAQCPETDKATIRSGFDRLPKGEGSFFDLPPTICNGRSPAVHRCLKRMPIKTNS